jgi:AraC-like DNA-binding protein
MLGFYIPIDDCLLVLIGPFLYLYVMEMYGRKQRFWSWKVIFQFVPIIPAAMRTLYFALLTPQVRAAMFIDGSQRVSWHATVIIAIFWIQILSYLIYLYAFIRKQSKQNHITSIESIAIDMSWLKNFLLTNIVLIIACILASLYLRTMPIIVKNGLIILNIQFGYFFILSVWQNGVLKEHPMLVQNKSISLESDYLENAINIEEEQLEGNKLQISEELADSYITLLLQLMIKEKPYLQQKCSVQDLAEATNIPTRYVSNSINNRLQKNVNDFINEFRIEAAKQKLQDPTLNITIEAIGLECGFGSKKSFNTAFKKHTDVTPSEYRKNIQNSNKIY